MQIKRIIRNTLILSLILISNIFAANTGKIAGMVSDEESGEGLLGANIVIQNVWNDGKKYEMQSPMGCATDMEGKYYLINVPAGEYDIIVDYIGYRKELREHVKVFPDKTTYVNFKLVPQSIQGETVYVVTRRANEADIDLTATRQDYDVSEIETVAGIEDISDIVSLQADVEDGHFRGGRSGEAGYLLDGGSVLNPLSNSKSFDPMTIGLEQVQVYTSGFSAEYGNVQSGLVNMVQKEGNRYEWKTNVKVNYNIGQYENFGGSVYDEDYNDFFNMLNSAEVFADSTDPATGALLWTYFGIQFPENYMRDRELIPGTFPPKFIEPTRLDTLRAANLIRILWLQSVRHIGWEYTTPDYRVSMSTGGPLSETLTMFVAGQYHSDQPFLPTTWPDKDIQFMGNLVYRPSQSHKIKVMYNFNHSFENDLTSNYKRWFEEVLSTGKTIKITHQYGIDYKYTMNKSTYINFNFNELRTHEKDNVDILGDDEFLTRYTSSLNWRHFTAPTGYQSGNIGSSTHESRTKTTNFSTVINSQLNNTNLLKSGFQLNFYDLEVDNRLSASSADNLNLEKYHENPFEGAIFIQDKIELSGMIANMGLRYDFYNFNTEYYVDKFSPYRVPGTVAQIDEKQAKKKNTKLKSLLEPRFGVSFPISKKTVFHLNYGVFMQRPSFRRVYTSVVAPFGTPPNYITLGNPQLEPMRTLSYDFGIVRMLPMGLSLDISTYLKDVSNLIQYAYYEDVNGNFYYTFNNQEYADIRGFHVSLEKKQGFFKGYLRYNWESDKGKAVDAIGGGGARSRYYENSPEMNEKNPPEDIFLSYNRLHRFIANIRFRIPEVFALVGGLNFSSTYNFLSGRPFTFDDNGEGLQMNKRTPNEHDLKFRISKTFEINTTNMLIFIEGFNMLNNIAYDYENVFGNMAGSGEFTTEYMKYKNGEISKEEFLTDNDFYPFVTSVDAFLIDNQPRYYRVGIEFKF